MTRKSKPKTTAKKQWQHKHAAVVPGPMLFKRSVSLTESIELSTNQLLGSAFGIISVSANGNSLPQASVNIPQQRIWNQYAAMFEYYQVKSVHAKFLPYRLEYTSGQLGGLSTRGYPVQSIIDPNSIPPTGNLPSSFFSYGNCNVTKPYDIHHRVMSNYTDLGLSKQSTLILKTNGSAQARELYTEPSSIVFLARGATIETTGTGNSNQIGLLVYTIDYEFLGQRAPGVDIPEPAQVSVDVNDSPQSQSPPQFRGSQTANSKGSIGSSVNQCKSNEQARAFQQAQNRQQLELEYQHQLRTLEQADAPDDQIGGLNSRS